jgi:hypothetical protein
MLITQAINEPLRLPRLDAILAKFSDTVILLQQPKPLSAHRDEAMPDLTIDQQILIAMRKTLAAVIKDVTPPPGMKHPLSERTIADVRQCLALISAREKELADAQGRAGERPYYADEPQSAHVVPIAGLGKGKKRD